MESARWCDSRSKYPHTGSPGIAAWIPGVGGGVDWGLLHRLGRRVCQQLQGVVLHSSWQILG